MSKMFNVRVPDELAVKVEKTAKEMDRSKSYIVKKALEEYIGEYIDGKIALKRSKDKRGKVFTTKEVRNKLGI